MKLYGVTESSLKQIVETVSRTKYAGNLVFRYIEPHRNHVQFCLRVDSSRGPGHRLGFQGRRLVAACWHAHRDVMRKIFDAYPEARLVSCQAVYNGAESFARTLERTGDRNIGSMVHPMYFREACDC